MTVDHNAIVIDDETDGVAQTEKRVPRQSLAAFDTLEQKPRIERPQFQVCRNRRIEIGGNIKGRVH